MTCFCRFESLAVVGVLDAAINALKVLVNRKIQSNRLVHFLIVGFKVRGHDFYVSIYQMLENIVTHDYNEAGVLVLQLLEVIVFGGVNDLILEFLVHRSQISYIIRPLSC